MADELQKQICPDVYSDLFNIYENALGVVVLLHKSIPPVAGKPGSVDVTKADTVVILRFSPQNWKTILMTGRKQLKARETALGTPIKLPEDLLKNLNLTEADW